MAWPGRPCTGGWRGIALTASRAWPTGPCAEQHPWRVSAEIEALVCELRRAHLRWERPAPMQLWQLDVTASLFLASGRECKVITGVDDHSRFCVIATVVLRA